MKAPTADEMMWTKEKIQKGGLLVQVATWGEGFFYKHAFSADTCSKCRATVNTAAHNWSGSWFCPCGGFNITCWSYHQFPHENPTYGPTAQTIKEAAQEMTERCV